MPQKTKEERAAYNKEYRAKNKDKLYEYTKAYQAENKEDISAQKKEYQQQNKEKIKEYNQSPQGKKSLKMNDWKRRGMDDDNQFIFDHYYLHETHCWVCKHEFCNKNWKCCDHDHTTGEFRQVLCHKCNVQDNWEKHSELV
jgi:hypothetical protein